MIIFFLKFNCAIMSRRWDSQNTSRFFLTGGIGRFEWAMSASLFFQPLLQRVHQNSVHEDFSHFIIPRMFKIEAQMSYMRVHISRLVRVSEIQPEHALLRVPAERLRIPSRIESGHSDSGRLSRFPVAQHITPSSSRTPSCEKLK